MHISSMYVQAHLDKPHLLDIWTAIRSCIRERVRFTRTHQATIALLRQAHAQVRAPVLRAGRWAGLHAAALSATTLPQADAPCKDIAADCSFQSTRHTLHDARGSSRSMYRSCTRLAGVKPDCQIPAARKRTAAQGSKCQQGAEYGSSS